MRLVQALREIFYFPFYFVSLNMAGFLSFVRFIQGSPPMWEKGDRVFQVLATAENVRDNCALPEEENRHEDESLDYPHVSSGGMR